MYEQSYGHDFDSSQLSNLSRTGGNRLWSENPRRQRCRDSSTSNLSLSPLYLRSEFGLLWSRFFLCSFLKSQIDLQYSWYLCTDVVIAAQKTRGSLAARGTRTLENRFKDLDFKRQVDWISRIDIACFHLRCGKAVSLFVKERLDLALACAKVVLKDNNRSLFRRWMKIGRMAF